MHGSPFDDYPYYDGPRQKQPDGQDRLRHVVFLDGRLVDSWTEPVEGTAYHSWAQQLDRSSASPLTLPRELPPPPHEAVLDWLDSAVGGRAALMALDTRPLEAGELPAGADEAYADVVRRLERVSTAFFDEELLAAMTCALSVLHAEGPHLLLEAPPPEVAAGLCWSSAARSTSPAPPASD